MPWILSLFLLFRSHPRPFFPGRSRVVFQPVRPQDPSSPLPSTRDPEEDALALEGVAVGKTKIATIFLDGRSQNPIPPRWTRGGDRGLGLPNFTISHVPMAQSTRPLLSSPYGGMPDTVLFFV